MTHYGDITKLSGYELPIVDVITGGSPCQDLSVAGNRAGLAGERSGLFMEQIRIVKEMRERDRRDYGHAGWAVRPRFMVWENVKGAFTSNGGQDFQAVLTEIVRISEPESPVVPLPDGGGRWPYSGCLYSDLGKWSVAWRLHDAQFWGVPQRRERIALVADFGGLSAPEILFERKGMHWNPAESGETRQGTTAGIEGGARSSISFQERAGKPGGARESSFSVNEQEPCQRSTISQYSVLPMEGNVARESHHGDGYGKIDDPGFTLNSVEQHAVAAFKAGNGSKARSIGYEAELAPTLSAAASGTNQTPAIVTSVDCRNGTEATDINGTLQAHPNGGFSYNCNNVVRICANNEGEEP